MGFTEGQNDVPRQSELNNSAIEPVCRRYAELRYRLMPYTYTLAAEARETGMPLMRAMWLHYPRDEHSRSLSTQYLWGRDLLIAPVYMPGAKSRDVYLPEGMWYDWWSGEEHRGPKTVTRLVDPATMPIYVRAGAIIPLDPVRQSTIEPVIEPTTLRIYPGADGRFRWYEDDGVSQEYLQGKFAWTTLVWDDDARQLTIERSKSSGDFDLPAREFMVELFREGKSQRLHYDGRRAQIAF